MTQRNRSPWVVLCVLLSAYGCTRWGFDDDSEAVVSADLQGGADGQADGGMGAMDHSVEVGSPGAEGIAPDSATADSGADIVTPESGPEIGAPDIGAADGPGPDLPGPAIVGPSLAGGYGHFCAVDTTGGAKCWGEGSSAQIGDGASVSRATPTSVVGLGATVVSVATANYSSCAVLADGRGLCWGDNSFQQLGTGTTGTASSPLPVAGVGDIAQIVFGAVSGCALTHGGDVYCWGFNMYGSVGLPQSAGLGPHLPSKILGGATSLVAGEQHVCAVIAGGEVRCWGSLDGGNRAQSYEPAQIIASGARSVVAGELHSCALMDSGGVECWGDNGSNQLGRSTPQYSQYALDVPGLANVSRLAATPEGSCAWFSDGSASCWGTISSVLTSATVTPTPIPEFDDADEIVTSNFALCRKKGGEVACWGGNSEGELGQGYFINEPVPKQAAVIRDPSVLALGSSRSCAIVSSGLYCVGNQLYSPLGDGNEVNVAVPTPAATTLSGISQAATESQHSCVAANGGVFCWGRNSSGQLGVGDTNTRLVPTPVVGLATTGITALAVGGARSCAIVSGALKCWGTMVGTGQATPDSLVPVQVTGLDSGVTQVASAANHACAVANGKLYCWGTNSAGQVGVPGSTATVYAPVEISQNLSMGVRYVATYNQSTCVVTALDGVRCWGNTSGSSPGPPATDLIAGAASVSVGYDHLCVLLSTGEVQCRGRNDFGQLGDGTTTDSITALVHANLPEGADRIVSSGYATLAVGVSGALYGWGYNWAGQLLLGYSGGSSLVPLTVSGL